MTTAFESSLAPDVVDVGSGGHLMMVSGVDKVTVDLDEQHSNLLQLALTAAAAAALGLRTVAAASVNNGQFSANSASERLITLREVDAHCSYDDCWIVLYDRVYDVTQFLQIVSE